MKKTMIVTLLSTAVFLTAPSLSYADNGNVFKGYSHKQKIENKKFKGKYKQKQNMKIAKNKLHKHNGKAHRHTSHTHSHAKHYNTRHNSWDPSFSISWNVGNGTVSVNNSHYGHGYSHGYKRPKTQRLTKGKKIYKRMNHQKRRIRNGIDSGQLVKREVRKLRREQRHINRTMVNFKRDGYLNRYERNKMNQLLDVASKNIKRKKDNRLTRYSRHHKHNT